MRFPPDFWSAIVYAFQGTESKMNKSGYFRKPPGANRVDFGYSDSSLRKNALEEYLQYEAPASLP
jgi:hypothetical protein